MQDSMKHLTNSSQVYESRQNVSALLSNFRHWTMTVT